MTSIRGSDREPWATSHSLERFEGLESHSDVDDDEESQKEETKKIADYDSEDGEYAGDDAGSIEEEEEEEEEGGDDDDDENDNDDNDVFFVRNEYEIVDEDGGSEEPDSEPDNDIDLLRGEVSSINGDEDEDDRPLQFNMTHNRITDEEFFSKGKLDRYASLYGPDTESLMNALKGRDRWCNNAIFPRRRVDERGNGGFHESFLRSDEAALAEATEDWGWYFEGGGRRSFERFQRLRDLDEATGKEYTAPLSTPPVKFVMGPRAKQKLTSLERWGWVRIEDIWREAEQEMQSQPKTNREPREGWIFNVGTTVQDVTWMPVRGRKIQYLVLVPDPLIEETIEYIDEDDIDSSDTDTDSDYIGPGPAARYLPAEPTPACIQFWAIPSSSEPEREGCMDYTSAPKLRLVLCTDWGKMRQMKWCPAPRDNRDEQVDFELFAGVWGDGKVRMVKMLAIPDEEEQQKEISTRYIKIEKVAFEVCPPETVCTCVEWLSASHLAVGCANGFVAIWDLTEHFSPTATSPIRNQRPYFYQPLHQTYVSTILSCYPSHPECILTTSMDGYVRLTSIQAPESDYVLAPRLRAGIAVQAWSDAIQSAFSPEDNNIIRALCLRRFYSGLNMVRHPADVLCMAAGSTHTTLLAGGADGSVVAFNPLRRLLKPRARNRHMTWFLHEWSSRRDGEGISRFSEGFKTSRGQNLRLFKEGLLITTVHEKKSAVTHLVWNPNALCGSWVVAAMGDGLLRVEDLAV